LFFYVYISFIVNKYAYYFQYDSHIFVLHVSSLKA